MLKYGMAGPAIPCQVTIQPTFGFIAYAVGATSILGSERMDFFPSRSVC
jgi:hypothetical protein